MRILILIALFLISFNSSSFSQSKKIQITIPSFPCLEKEYHAEQERHLRNGLNEMNTMKPRVNLMHDFSEKEYERLLLKSDQFDLIQLSLLRLFPYAIWNHLCDFLRPYYPDEKSLLIAYNFLITEESKKRKELAYQFEPDFKINIDRLRFTNEDYFYYTIHFISKNGEPIVYSDSLQARVINGNSLQEDLFESYKIMTLGIASKIAESDSFWMKSDSLMKKRKEKLLELKIIQNYIPPLLKNKLIQEVEFLKDFEFSEGILKKDSTVFKGIFNRVFIDSIEYKDFIISTKRPGDGISRKSYFTHGPMTYFIEGLNLSLIHI